MLSLFLIICVIGGVWWLHTQGILTDFFSSTAKDINQGSSKNTPQVTKKHTPLITEEEPHITEEEEEEDRDIFSFAELTYWNTPIAKQNFKRYGSKLSLADSFKLLDDSNFRNRMDYLLDNSSTAQYEFYCCCQLLTKKQTASHFPLAIQVALREGGVDLAIFFLLSALLNGIEESKERFWKKYRTYPDLISTIKQMEIEYARPEVEMKLYIQSQARLWDRYTPPPLPRDTLFLTDEDIASSSPYFTIDFLGKTQEEVMQEIQDKLKNYFAREGKSSNSKDNWCVQIRKRSIVKKLELELKGEKPPKEDFLLLLVSVVNSLPTVVKFFKLYGNDVDRYGYSKAIDYSIHL